MWFDANIAYILYRDIKKWGFLSLVALYNITEINVYCNSSDPFKDSVPVEQVFASQGFWGMQHLSTDKKVGGVKTGIYFDGESVFLLHEGDIIYYNEEREMCVKEVPLEDTLNVSTMLVKQISDNSLVLQHINHADMIIKISVTPVSDPFINDIQDIKLEHVGMDLLLSMLSRSALNVPVVAFDLSSDYLYCHGANILNGKYVFTAVSGHVMRIGYYVHIPGCLSRILVESMLIIEDVNDRGIIASCVSAFGLSTHRLSWDVNYLQKVVMPEPINIDFVTLARGGFGGSKADVYVTKNGESPLYMNMLVNPFNEGGLSDAHFWAQNVKDALFRERNNCEIWMKVKRVLLDTGCFEDLFYVFNVSRTRFCEARILVENDSNQYNE